MAKQTAFYPGKPWLDENDFRIQAHGGSVFYENGTYYWYGEDKGKTLPGSPIWHYGVKMYSSKDLYNWKDEGNVLLPVIGEVHPLNPKRVMDRPHILFNQKTGKYVMWMKLAGTDEEPQNFDLSRPGIAVADKITGPYTFMKTILPRGEDKFGDFDLFLDEKTGKAYCVFERPHTEMVVGTLSDDFTDFSGEFSSHFFFKYPPFIREAPCVIPHKGKYYMITSGTTGYYPNPSQVAVADDMHGPWKVLGDLCVNDVKRNSFHAQFSSAFRVQGTDLYIATGDRWLTDLPEEMPDVCEVFEGWFNPDKEPVMTGEELNKNSAHNTSLADYVWLPVRFVEGGEEDGVEIAFYPKWRVEDFTK